LSHDKPRSTEGDNGAAEAESKAVQLTGCWSSSTARNAYKIASKDDHYIYEHKESGAEGELQRIGDWWQGDVKVGIIRLQLGEEGTLKTQSKKTAESEWESVVIAYRIEDSQKQREPIRLPKDLREHLDGKDYAVALEEVLQNTALRPADLDPKVLRLLDTLEMKGTSRAACRRLRDALEGKARQRIDNWRSYAYSLVRSYDPEAYQRMKDSGNDNRPKPPREKAEKADAVDRRRKERKKHPVSNFDFRCSAPEFIPGISRHGQSEGASSEGASADARAEALLEELASPLLSR